MLLTNWLIDHAPVIVVAAPLLGLDGACVVGGFAAAVGSQSLAAMLLVALQGQVLAELLSLSTNGHRWCPGLICGARFARRIGVTRAVLDGGATFQRWLLTIYCFLGAAMLVSIFIFGGYVAGKVLTDIDAWSAPMCLLLALASVALTRQAFRRTQTKARLRHRSS